MDKIYNHYYVIYYILLLNTTVHVYIHTILRSCLCTHSLYVPYFRRVFFNFPKIILIVLLIELGLYIFKIILSGDIFIFVKISYGYSNKNIKKYNSKSLFWLFGYSILLFKK